jgi:hypothetical protein
MFKFMSFQTGLNWQTQELIFKKKKSQNNFDFIFCSWNNSMRNEKI